MLHIKYISEVNEAHDQRNETLMNSRLAAVVDVGHQTGRFTIVSTLQLGQFVYWKNVLTS